MIEPILLKNVANLNGEVYKNINRQVQRRRMKQQLAKMYDIDLGNSYAYGDTHGDITMLNYVGYPTAINPTKELLLNIQQDKDLLARIRVIVERKDVIYNIDLNSLRLE